MSEESLEVEYDLDGPAESDPAPAEVESQEPAEMSKPKPVEKRISTLVSKLSHKDQELARLQQENEALKKSTSAPSAKPASLPDEDLKYDNPAEYKAQLAEYQKSVAIQAYEELEQRRKAEAEQVEAREQQEESQKRYQDLIGSYVDNGLRAGLSEDKMLANEHALKVANMDTGLVERLYSDPNGHALVNYLADHPDELQKVASMNPYDAAVTIATEIKQAALSTKPTYTNAPDPISPTRGGGTPPVNDWDRLADGATFE